MTPKVVFVVAYDKGIDFSRTEVTDSEHRFSLEMMCFLSKERDGHCSTTLASVRGGGAHSDSHYEWLKGPIYHVNPRVGS